MSDYRAIGDSITDQTAATDSAHCWRSLLSASLGVSILNYGHSGDMVPDRAAITYGFTGTSDEDKYFFALGVNDERIYGVDATKLGYYRRGLQCLVAWAALKDKTLAKGASGFTGTWEDTAVYGIGRNSYTLNSTWTRSVCGTVVYLGMIQQDSAPGAFTVQIDGGTPVSFTTQTTGLATLNGLTYGPMLLRFPGLSSGSHTVVVKVTSATSSASRVYCDWIAGNAQTIFPKVYVSNVLRAQAYTAGGSDANVAAYNVEVAGLVAELVADGLAVRLVDVCSALDPATDMDGAYHPVNVGHAKYAQKELDVVSQDMATARILTSGGNYFAQRTDGTGTIRL